MAIGVANERLVKVCLRLSLEGFILFEARNQITHRVYTYITDCGLLNHYLRSTFLAIFTTINRMSAANKNDTQLEVAMEISEHSERKDDYDSFWYRSEEMDRKKLYASIRGRPQSKHLKLKATY